MCLQADVEVARKILTYVLDENASGRSDSDEEEGSHSEEAGGENKGSRSRRR